jgi:hypothetical protein
MIPPLRSLLHFLYHHSVFGGDGWMLPEAVCPQPNSSLHIPSIDFPNGIPATWAQQPSAPVLTWHSQETGVKMSLIHQDLYIHPCSSQVKVNVISGPGKRKRGNPLSSLAPPFPRVGGFRTFEGLWERHVLVGRLPLYSADHILEKK